MPAAREDAVEVLALVTDAVQVLDWAASNDAYVLDDELERAQRLMPESLLGAYQEALDQARQEAFALAILTLSGENPTFPIEAVLATLQLAGWTGALRAFKLQVLEESGRSEVRQATSGGRRGGGGIRGRVLGGFLGALNAALDSLSGVPGVAVIKELKDFLERAAER